MLHAFVYVMPFLWVPEFAQNESVKKSGAETVREIIFTWSFIHEAISLRLCHKTDALIGFKWSNTEERMTIYWKLARQFRFAGHWASMCDKTCFCLNKQDTMDETCIFCTIAKGDDRYTEILAQVSWFYLDFFSSLSWISGFTPLSQTKVLYNYTLYGVLYKEVVSVVVTLNWEGNSH